MGKRVDLIGILFIQSILQYFISSKYVIMAVHFTPILPVSIKYDEYVAQNAWYNGPRPKLAPATI